jgi:hypothetical protein
MHTRSRPATCISLVLNFDVSRTDRYDEQLVGFSHTTEPFAKSSMYWASLRAPSIETALSVDVPLVFHVYLRGSRQKDWAWSRGGPAPVEAAYSY